MGRDVVGQVAIMRARPSDARAMARVFIKVFGYRASLELVVTNFEVSYGGVEVLNGLPRFALEFDHRVFGADRTRVLVTWVRRGAKVLVVARDGYAWLRKGFLGSVMARSYGSPNACYEGYQARCSADDRAQG